MEKILEFSICRTCLRKKESTKCKKLTTETLYEGKVLVKILNFCIPEMHIDLALENPAICRKCLQKINSLYKFKNMCLKNDSKYCKNTDLNGCKRVPFTDSYNTNSSLTVSTASDKIGGTDVNQNDTSTMSKAITDQIGFHKKVKKKNFSPYRKRFTNTDCFGCQNHIRDGKYHISDLCNKEYICFNCGKKLASIQEIRKHMYTHLYLCECEICGKKWRDAYQLTQHLRSHTKQKPYKCPVCCKRFVQSHNLHQHLGTHKGDEDNQNRCKECGKILSTKYNLKIHMTTHNIGGKPRCSVCKKWFYTEAALGKHSKICRDIKEENEIFIDEPEFIETEVLEYVKSDLPEYAEVPQYFKGENQSDDDVFLEETPPHIISANRSSIVNSAKEEKFTKIALNLNLFH